jgi:hypothetical protein
MRVYVQEVEDEQYESPPRKGAGMGSRHGGGGGGRGGPPPGRGGNVYYSAGGAGRK